MQGTTYGGMVLDRFAQGVGLAHALAHPEIVVHLQARRARLIGPVDVQLQDPPAPLDLGVDQGQQVGERPVVLRRLLERGHFVLGRRSAERLR